MTIVNSFGFKIIPFGKMASNVTPEENALLSRVMRDSFELSSTTDGLARNNKLRRSLDTDGIITAVLKLKSEIFRAGIFAKKREEITKFLQERGLKNLAEDFNGYGIEAKPKYPPFEDPAIKRFLTELALKVKQDSQFAADFAKLLMKVL